MRQPLALDRERVRQALIAVLDHAMPACAGIDYRLVGTAAALLHGVRLPSADIDILIRQRSDLDAFAAALRSLACRQAPVWLPDSRQYYAGYDVGGIEVEFSTVEVDSDADTIETFGSGPWEHCAMISCGDYLVPVVALELRLITELVRGRPDRYEPLIEHMQHHGCDQAFIRRGIENFEQALRDRVLAALADAPHRAVSVRPNSG